MAEERKGRKYGKVPAAAIVDIRLSAEALRVLCVLGVCANEDGIAYPAVPTIAANLGIDRRGVQRHLRRLEELQYIRAQEVVRFTRGGSGRTRYHLVYERVHLKGPAPRKDKRRKGAATDAAPAAPKSADLSAKAGRHLDEAGAATDDAPGAAFRDDRGGTQRRPINTMRINTDDQQREEQHSVPRRAEVGSINSEKMGVEQTAPDAWHDEPPVATETLPAPIVLTEDQHRRHAAINTRFMAAVKAGDEEAQQAASAELDALMAERADA